MQQIEKEQQVKVQEAEILRHEKELIATVLKQSEIERQRIENLAAAEKSRLMMEAEGRAAAIRATRRSGSRDHLPEGRSRSQGDERKGRGLPGVDPGRRRRQAHHQHAGRGPRHGRAASKVDKITIVSTGGDGSVGANKITGDMTKIAAQVPALFEALSGMDMHELMNNVKSMRARPNGATSVSS